MFLKNYQKQQNQVFEKCDSKQMLARMWWHDLRNPKSKHAYIVFGPTRTKTRRGMSLKSRHQQSWKTTTSERKDSQQWLNIFLLLARVTGSEFDGLVFHYYRELLSYCNSFVIFYSKPSLNTKQFLSLIIFLYRTIWSSSCIVPSILRTSVVVFQLHLLTEANIWLFSFIYCI